MISILTPYFNAEKTLERAINSIIIQTHREFELILVDNMSTDNSNKIAREIASKDSRVKLISENTQGVVFAANSGMKVAQGKYIARMDADDLAHPERLEKQLKHLESNPELSISATQVNYQNDHSEISDFVHFVDWSNQQHTWSDIYQNQFVEFPVVNPTLMFRKSVIDDVGLLKEGDFPEDYEWFLRAIDKGHKIEKIPTPLLDWHDSSNSLTRTDVRYSTDSFFQIKTIYLAKHLKKIHQSNVWIWGAGKLGFKRSQWLLSHGIQIEGYIDIKKDKQLNGFSCVHFESINTKTQSFIISYITNRNKRDEVRSFLDAKGYHEGENYIIAG